MKTLTANAEAQRAAAYHAPRLLFEVDWDQDASWSGKYSDQALTIGGDTYEAYVLSWGGYETSLDLRSLGSIDQLQVTMKTDDTENFYAICASNVAEGKHVRFGLWFSADGAGSDDIIWLFYGEIAAVDEVGGGGVKLDCVELIQRYNKRIPEHDINRDDFPDAPDESIGKSVPIVFGEIEKFPCAPVTAGASTDLYGSHGPDDETIRVYSVEGFPASGTITIEDEEILYADVDASYSWMGATVCAFTGCTRGANSTETAMHRHGVSVTEVVAETVFVVADHACKEISSVRVRGQIADASTYSIDTADTGLVTGRTLATISFPGMPQIAEQSRSVVRAKLRPTGAGDGNANGQYALAIDEVEANTAAVVATTSSPLVVKRAAAITAADINAANLLGPITRAWAAIEYSVDEEFARGEITTDVVPDHDCTVEKIHPDTNCNASESLDALDTAAGNQRRFYVRLDAGSIPENYSTVSLRLKDRSSGDPYTPDTLKISQVASSWDETTITWNNQPNGTGTDPTGTLLASKDISGVEVGDWVEISLPITTDLSLGVVGWIETTLANKWAAYHTSEMPAADQPHFRFTYDDPDSGDYDIAMKVIREGVESDPFYPWDPKWGHARPAWDTFERDIGRYVADLANRDTAYPTCWVTFNLWNITGGGATKIASPGNAVDGDWSTSALFWTGSGTDCQYIDYTSSTDPPEAGTIRRVRFHYRGKRNSTGRIALQFYVMDELICENDNVYQDGRITTDWYDIAFNGYDLETAIKDATTKIRVTPHGTDYLWLWMVGMEFEYEPSGGGDDPSASAPQGTITNYIDLLETGIMDVSADTELPLDEHIVPAHDATVDQGQPGTPHGGGATLEVHGTGLEYQRIYLRCDPAQLPAASYDTIQLCLRVKTGTAGDVTLTVVAAAQTWNESSITWYSQPNGSGITPTGSLLASQANEDAGEWNVITLPSTVDLSLGVCVYCTEAAGAVFYSSEETEASNRPHFRVARSSGTAIGDIWQWFNGTNIALYNAGFGGTLSVFNVWFEIEYLPVAMVDSFDVSADVQGIEDAGDGTGTLLDNPADIIQYILTDLLGVPEANIDTAAFTAARASLDSFGAVFGFGLDEAGDAWQILSDLAAQARCWLNLRGRKYQLRYRLAIYSASERTIATTGVTGRLPGTGKLMPLRLSEIANDITLKYREDYSAGDQPYTRIVRGADAESQTAYGLRQRTLEGWALRDDTFAGALVTYLLMRDKNARNLYVCETLLGNCDVEPGDILAFTESRWGMSAAKGEVVQVRLLPGSAPDKRAHRIELTALLEPYTIYWGDSETAIIIIGGRHILGGIGGIPIFRGVSQEGAAGASIIYIKGFVINDQTLAASGDNPIYWDSSAGRLKFALNDNTTVFEFDAAGNLYVPVDVLDHQTLTLAGGDNEVDSDASDLWINIDGVRILEADGTFVKVPTFIVENAGAAQLL